MSIQHKSRTGKIYHLHVGEGKSGKPNYFFSATPEGPTVDSIPDGFEIYENVRGQIFLRRKLPQLFTEDELTLVKSALRAHAAEWRYKIELKKNALVIYEANDRIADLQNIAAPWISKAKIRECAIQTASYMAVMRFVLTDRQKRLFFAERFCFQGSVDDWIHIGRPDKLPVLLKSFVKHLGKDSIYELS